MHTEVQHHEARVVGVVVRHRPERREGVGIGRRPASKDEKVIESSQPIYGEVFHPKGIRDSELVCGQQSHADICDRIRPLNVRWNVVLTENKNVGRRERPGDSGIEICARHVLEESRVRRGTAVNDAARDV